MHAPAMHVRIALTIIAANLLLGAYWLLLDRSPPTVFVRTEFADYVGPSTIRVRNTLERKRFCDLTVSRIIEDASGYRFYPPPFVMSAEDVAAVEEVSPGEARVDIDLPRGAVAGPLMLYVRIEYVCNPMQNLWPIAVRFSVPIPTKESYSGDN